MQDYHWKKKKKKTINIQNSFLQPKKKTIFIFDFWNGKTFFIKKGLEMICMGSIRFFFFFFFENFYFENWKQRWLKRFSFTWHLSSWVQTFKRGVAGQILGWVLGPLSANGEGLLVMDICKLVSRMMDGPWNLASLLQFKHILP